MSDKDLTTDAGEEPAAADTDQDAAPLEDAQFAEAKPPSKFSATAPVAWLALLLSAAATTYLAFDFLRDDSQGAEAAQSATDIAALQATVRTLRESVAVLEQSVSTLSTLDGTRSAEMDALRRQLDDRLRQYAALPGRIMNLEGTVSSLQGVSAGARNAWLLAEAEYYMQIANAQLQLAGNPHLAALALTLADERVLQLADPGLVDVRRALADEMRALEAIERPDTEGITLQLASLAASVESLPLRNDIDREGTEKQALDTELSGTDRAMASLRSALGNVVSVRRTDEALQPLLAPEAQYFLRTNLALQFQAARLAVLRSDEAIFSQSIDDAAAWLDAYFDGENDAVKSAQQAIASMRGSTFAVARPDISGSLRLLRQFDAYSRIAEERLETPQSDAAEQAQEPQE